MITTDVHGEKLINSLAFPLNRDSSYNYTTVFVFMCTNEIYDNLKLTRKLSNDKTIMNINISINVNVNVSVNVEVYSLKSPWVQQTLQFTPLILELSLIRSHLLWGEFGAFSAADAIHNFSNFRSTRYPSQLRGQRQHVYERFCPTPLHIN